MELRCHRPPRAPIIPLRFNSFARPRSEAKPAAISFRMVGSKARARASASCLHANEPCLLANALGILRLGAEVFPRTIGRNIGGCKKMCRGNVQRFSGLLPVISSGGRAVLCDASQPRSLLYGCSCCRPWLDVTGFCHSASGKEDSNAPPESAQDGSTWRCVAQREQIAPTGDAGS
jgi:hypothetical protein